jgi:hypothetical protein
MRKLNKKVITLVSLVLILAFGSVIGFLNFTASQSAKKEFASLCENFIKTSPALVEELSSAQVNDEIRIPKLALLKNINSYKNSLGELTKYSGARETKEIIISAEVLLKDFLDLKDRQGNVEFRNPYRLEYKAYLDMLPLVAIRSLSDPAYQERFLAMVAPVEAKYKAFNTNNFDGNVNLMVSKGLFTKKIGEANILCKEAKNTK